MYEMSKLMKQNDHILVRKERWFTGTTLGEVTNECSNRIYFVTVTEAVLADRKTRKVRELVKPWIKIKVKAAYLFAVLVHFIGLYFFNPYRHIAYFFYLY